MTRDRRLTVPSKRYPDEDYLNDASLLGRVALTSQRIGHVSKPCGGAAADKSVRGPVRRRSPGKRIENLQKTPSGLSSLSFAFTTRTLSSSSEPSESSAAPLTPTSAESMTSSKPPLRRWKRSSTSDSDLSTSQSSECSGTSGTCDGDQLTVLERRKKIINPARQLLREWLLCQADNCCIPGLRWLNKQQLLVRIPWKHGSKAGWTAQDDGLLYEKWAQHTGRFMVGKNDPKRWKANFRCALNSLPDVKEVPSQSVTRGKDAYRVYRFMEEVPRKSVVKRRSTKVKTIQQCLKLLGDIGGVTLGDIAGVVKYCDVGNSDQVPDPMPSPVSGDDGINQLQVLIEAANQCITRDELVASSMVPVSQYSDEYNTQLLNYDIQLGGAQMAHLGTRVTGQNSAVTDLVPRGIELVYQTPSFVAACDQVVRTSQPSGYVNSLYSYAHLNKAAPVPLVVETFGDELMAEIQQNEPYSYPMELPTTTISMTYSELPDVVRDCNRSDITLMPVSMTDIAIMPVPMTENLVQLVNEYVDSGQHVYVEDVLRNSADFENFFTTAGDFVDVTEQLVNT